MKHEEGRKSKKEINRQLKNSNKTKKKNKRGQALKPYKRRHVNLTSMSPEDVQRLSEK